MTDIDKRIDEIMELDKGREHEGEWKYIPTANGGNGGIRNNAGFICFLTDVSRYSGQEERYEKEIKQRFAHGHFIAKAPEMVEIIKHLQAQVVERDNENKHLKATLGAIQSLCCQFEGGVADAIKEFIQTGEVK